MNEDNDDLNPNSEPDDLSGTNLPEEGSEENEAIRDESSNSMRKGIQEALSKTTTKNAATKSLIKSLLPILTWVLVFIIILIIIIGVVLFFITMPGMVMDKLKELSKNVGKGIAAFFGADTTKQVDDEEICDVLDYLEQMGYDLKGYGFLTDYVGAEDGEGVERYTAEEAESKEEKSEGDIKEAKSDFIFTYLVSDNYIYTIANFNQTTGGNGGFWQSIFTAIKSVLLKMGNILTGGQLGQHWGRGMIELYDEQKDFWGNSILGKKGEYYRNGLFDKIKIKIDEEKNKRVLSIKRGIGGETLEYNLDGWTGRYGMPIDFLLSIHLATMMPDLAYDMVESFDTKITLLLHNDFPYIAYVKDHWYRDVYFVKNLDDEKEKNIEFVDYDYDYEALMKERWTLYETYEEDEVGNDKSKVGEYKLYEINDDGTYKEENGELKLFEGTTEDAEREGIKVAKKAKTINYEDEEQFEDVNWNKVRNSLWSAYKLTNEGNIKQTGEGLRTETNSEIKKIFLENQYFRYDGSSETADKITELRKKISKNEDNLYYGPVKGIDSDGKEVDYTETEIEDKNNKEQKIKISDVSGTVSLNQDSLNAFSMLENEHTLDADYIYRDFKELIVELGYFEKEKLTDETPRLLEFLVPDIGSYMYPKRSIDKNENEYGTMIHSKGDIDAAKERSIAELLKKAEEEGEPETPPESPDNNNVEPQQSVSKLTKDSSLNIIGKVASLGSTPIADLRAVGSIVEVAPANYTYTPTGQSGQTKKIADLNFNGVNYECWFQSQVTCTLYSFSFIASVYTDTSFEEYKKEQPPYWVGGLTWNCWKTAGVEGVFYGAGDAPIPSTVEEQGSLISEALNEGKPVYFYSGFGSSAGYHAIVLLGADDNGKVLYYNPWGGVVTTYGSSSRFSENLRELLTVGAAQKGGHLYSFFIPDEPPEGDIGELYVGYLGNEMVVSPVTGILLEYGTYNDEYEDSISGEKYRTNVDLKYPSDALERTYEEPTNQTNSQTGQSPVSGQIQVDKVGYAKILVLDQENYKKLEEELLPKTRWKNDGSFSNENGTYKDFDSLTKKDINGDKNNNKERWTDIEKTLYGYKEFAERYEKAGISGYVIYIDGFKCEKPDEKFDNEDKNQLESSAPEGEEILFKDYKKTTMSSFNSNGDIKNKKDLLDTLYESEDDYQLVSERATNKLEAEEIVKEQAIPSFCFEDKDSEDEDKDLIFIKEGTILGRTITDFELIEKYRNQKYHDFRDIEEYDENGKQKPDKIIGNYIRIIMRDLDTTVVENVEDYMKLDDNIEDEGLGEIEKFMYWQAMEPEGFFYDLRPDGPVCLENNGHTCRRENPSDKYGHDYAVCDGGAGDLNLCPGIWLANGGYGSSGGAIFRKVTGVNYIHMYSTWCTGEQMIDIYYQELMVVKDHVKDALAKCGKDIEELEDHQTFALMDTAYAGAAYLRSSSLPSTVAGGGTPSMDQFMNATPKGKRRRMCDYYMYTKEAYVVGVHSTKPITLQYNFTSKTPFQDLMVDENGAEKVSFTP